MRCPAGEGGAATLVVLAMAGVLLLVGAALGVAQALVVDHRRAQAAADLAALAGASAGRWGLDACDAVRRVATANAAELTSCTVVAGVVDVVVRVAGPRWLGQTSDLTAQARAGPGSAPARPGPDVRQPLSSGSRSFSSSTLSSLAERSSSFLRSRRCCMDRFTPNLLIV